jgi:cellulose synthase/poly-beta-1,6-N-acetylglucosamine synthase-like glycosyltransferase/putative flippase GtrA
MKDHWQRAVGGRFVTFSAGGGLIAVVGLLLLSAFVAMGMGHAAAYAAQLILTFAANYAFNRFVTFRDRPAGLSGAQLGRFLGTRGVMLVGGWALFVAQVDGLGVPYLLAYGVCLAVTSAVNYWTTDVFVFPDRLPDLVPDAAPSAITAGAPSTAARGPVPAFARPAPVTVLPAVRSEPFTATMPKRYRVSRDGPPRPRRTAISRPVNPAVCLVLLIPFAVLAFVDPLLALLAFIVVVALFNFVISSLEARWMVFGWRQPEAVAQMGFPPASSAEDVTTSFSIIVPALKEAAVLEETLRRLAAQTHPHVDIVVTLVVGDDETILAAERARDAHPDRIRVVVKQYRRSSKPRQLNAALPFCTGEYVGVIDAEDDVDPRLLLHVDALIRREQPDVVQGGVQLMNLGQRMREWFCVHNVLEYYFWFPSRLPFQVKQGFVPLGGNTVFIQRDLLISAGGWPDNLTEDCALGVELCTDFGAKVVAAYDPELVTREETPDTVRGLRRQRTRWSQGFLSVLMQGRWRMLPTFRQRLMAFYILAMPFLQAASALLLPVSLITAVLVKAHVALVLLTFAPFVPILLTVVLRLVGLAEFGRVYGQRVRWRHYAFLVVGAGVYQLVLMWSAAMAVKRYMTAQFDWDKTDHSGQHRVAPAC